MVERGVVVRAALRDEVVHVSVRIKIIDGLFLFLFEGGGEEIEWRRSIGDGREGVWS